MKNNPHARLAVINLGFPDNLIEHGGSHDALLAAAGLHTGGIRSANEGRMGTATAANSPITTPGADHRAAAKAGSQQS